MVVELRKLSPSDGMDVYKLLQDIPKNENGFQNGCNGLSYDEYKKWLIRSDNIASGVGLEDWMAPQTIYWLYVDDKPVGMGKLRHRLTDKLKEEGGHCGYAIASAERQKGYGKLLLNKMIDEARGLSIDRLLITVSNHNLPSIKVAVGNGGIIERTSDVRHYIWIDCHAQQI